MPDESKQEVVSLLSKHHIPLIEDDTYGDIHFGAERPKCCSSVSKTLAPGYRVGWVAPGRYKDQILKLKLVHAISATSVIHEAVGNFLMTGRYDHHLRHFRKTLQEKMM